MATVLARNTTLHQLFAPQSRPFATQKAVLPWRKKKRLLLKRQTRLQELQANPDRYKRTHIKRHNYLIDSPPDNKRWRILAASILHRYPVIQPDLKPYEEAFARMQYEISLREDMRVPEEFWTLEPDEKMLSPEEAPSPFDPMDPYFTVGDNFSPAPRWTKDDEENNHKSLDRALDRHLILILKQPEQSAMPNAWFFPHLPHKPQEKMRKTAMKSFVFACGKRSKVYPMGNAPIGYVSYEHENSDSEYDGTKVFLYKARLVGEAALELKQHKAVDFAWVTRDELQTYLEPELAEYVRKIVPQ